MDKTIQSLVQDHWLLRRALNALEAFSLAQAQGELSREDLHQFAGFFEFFGDVHHAVKEEDVLFPALANAGVGEWSTGPLAEARREHRQERYLMRVLKQYAGRDGEFDGPRRRELVTEIEAFLHSMRRHLAFEEEHVFPLVTQMSAEQQQQLTAALDKFDNSPPSSEECSRWRDVMTKLAEKHAW